MNSLDVKQGSLKISPTVQAVEQRKLCCISMRERYSTHGTFLLLFFNFLYPLKFILVDHYFILNKPQV